VVVHIIHNNGPENISDAQVMTAIQHLNEAYANSGYFDPADGEHQYPVLHGRTDPDNNPTNGITRDVSSYTVMVAPLTTDDQNAKYPPLAAECYINIWVVKSIPEPLSDTLSPRPCTNLDGIVLEAGYFGSSYPNDVVITHGWPLSWLYHTFEGGCTNNDCS